MVQQDPWEHATLPQSTRAHSVWATAQASDPACGHRLKGKHTVKQVAFAMFYKKGCGPPCTNCPSDVRLLFHLAYNQLNIC